MFKNILGDKGLLTSWTAWGVFLFALGPGLVDSAAQAGFITPEGSTLLHAGVAKLGGVLAALGVRRALGRGTAEAAGA